MFDKTFFRFAIGFAVVIVSSVGMLYMSGYFGDKVSEQTASVR